MALALAYFQIGGTVEIFFFFLIIISGLFTEKWGERRGSLQYLFFFFREMSKRPWFSYTLWPFWMPTRISRKPWRCYTKRLNWEVEGQTNTIICYCSPRGRLQIPTIFHSLIICIKKKTRVLTGNNNFFFSLLKDKWHNAWFKLCNCAQNISLKF